MRPEYNQKALILLGFTYTSRSVRAMVITRKRCNSAKETFAMTIRRAAAPNDKALESFLVTKARIDQMLARIQTLSDDHFNTDPDSVHWGDVGTLSHYSSLLRQITDIAFKEGEHAA